MLIICRRHNLSSANAIAACTGSHTFALQNTAVLNPKNRTGVLADAVFDLERKVKQMKNIICCALPPNSDGRRNAVEIRAALGIAKEAAKTLADRLASAQIELADANSAYENDMREFALGRANEPDRTRMQSAIALVSALQKLSQEQQREIEALTIDLGFAEFQDKTAADQQKLDSLTLESQDALQTFEIAVRAVRLAEEKLFGLLFGEKSGLKQQFSTSEQQNLAWVTRCGLRDQAIAMAKVHGYKINPDFATDGNPNLADPDRQWEAHSDRMAQEATRIGECAGAPREMGALVPDKVGEIIPEGTYRWER